MRETRRVDRKASSVPTDSWNEAIEAIAVTRLAANGVGLDVLELHSGIRHRRAILVGQPPFERARRVLRLRRAEHADYDNDMEEIREYSASVRRRAPPGAKSSLHRFGLRSGMNLPATERTPSAMMRYAAVAVVQTVEALSGAVFHPEMDSGINPLKYTDCSTSAAGAVPSQEMRVRT